MERQLPEGRGDDKPKRPMPPLSSNLALNLDAAVESSGASIGQPAYQPRSRSDHFAYMHPATNMYCGIEPIPQFSTSMPQPPLLSAGEAPMEDTRIQLDLPIDSLPFGERHQIPQGILVGRHGAGGYDVATNDTLNVLKTKSTNSASQMPSASVPQSDQIGVDLNLTFPVKLHMILTNPQFQMYVQWAPHGRAWKVLNPKAFERDVIPRFFRSDKYSSFMRQVNGWAFSRITDGPDANAYWHPLFLRGLPSLANKMRRPPKTKNSAAVARAGSGGKDAESPNFYRISRIAPVPGAAPSSTFMPHRNDAMMDDQMDAILDFDHAQMMSWGSPPPPVEKNPFEDDSSPEAVESKAALSKDDYERKHRKTNAPDQGQESQRLSDADLQYLAQQNRWLLSYASQTNHGEADDAVDSAEGRGQV